MQVHRSVQVPAAALGQPREVSNGYCSEEPDSTSFTRNMAMMREAIVRVGTKVDIIDSPVPNPGRDQILMKIVVSGSNPKDW